MKTTLTLVKGPPLRRVLCSFLCGAAAFCVVPTNGQAGQAPGDIIWVTVGNTIAEYKADGTAINTNFLTEQPVPLWFPRLYGIPHLGGILACASGGIGGMDPILYVAAEWVPSGSFVAALLQGYWRSWYNTYVIATYDAVTGRSIFTATHRFGVSYSPPRPPRPFGPAGMAVLGTNHGIYYVANSSGNSITQGGNLNFIQSTATNVLKAPYALAVNGNVLYVTNNAQNLNGKFYISTYDATTGNLINPNLIEISTSGLYGLALSQDNTTLYVSDYSGGVHTYAVSNPTVSNPLGSAQERSPLFAVKQPWGIAIEGNTLYVASYSDAAIYEFDATTGVRLPYSIKLSSAPTNITVEPAAALGL